MSDDEESRRTPERLRRGELRAKVLAVLVARPGEEFGPVAVAKILGRSAGAINNALVRLAEANCGVTQVRENPRRYRYRPEGDDGGV